MLSLKGKFTTAKLRHVFVAILLLSIIQRLDADTVMSADSHFNTIDSEIFLLSSNIIANANKRDHSADYTQRLLLRDLLAHRLSITSSTDSNKMDAKQTELSKAVALFGLAERQGHIEQVIIDSLADGVIQHHSYYQLVTGANTVELLFIDPLLIEKLLAEQLSANANSGVSVNGVVIDNMLIVLDTLSEKFDAVLDGVLDGMLDEAIPAYVNPSLVTQAIVPSTLSANLAAPLLPNCSSTGEQNALVIAVNYQDDSAEIPSLQTINDRYFNAGDSLASYWQDVSYGKTTLAGVNLGWHTLDASISSTNACNMTNEIRQQAIDLAAQQVNISEYTRLFIVMRQFGAGCNFIGQGTLNCPIISTTDSSQSARLSTHWVLGNVIGPAQSGLDIITHEAGHNLGFNHAERLLWTPDETGPILDNSGATVLQQGDGYDTMGSSVWPAHYNAIHKQQAQWLEPAQTVAVNAAATITLQSLSKASAGTQAIKLYRGANAAGKKEYFVLETRSQDGFDSQANVNGIAAIHIHQQSDESDAYTYLIDANPATPTLADSALAIGQIFFDPFSGISISNQGLDSNGDVMLAISTSAGFIDSDEDGVIAQLEAQIGSDNNLWDTDGDGDSDKWEICADGDCDTYLPYPGGGDLNPTTPDTDGDGMYDRWERVNGLNAKDPSDAGLDPDLDGVTNLNEFLMGTDPQGGDSDGDGLTDGLELSIGTSTSNPDTDMDGLPDGWEYYNQLNPLDITDAANDPDFDTLTNLHEFTLGTSPINDDSDGDALLDQDEVNFYLTNPANADTDDDRLSDFEELANGSDPLTQSPDTDGDGMNDDWESIRGTQVAIADAVEDPDQDGVFNIIEYLKNSLPRVRSSVPQLRIIYVDSNAAPLVEDGSMLNPFTRINRGLDAAEAGDTVMVASGVYNSNTEQILNFNKSIRVSGPPDRSAIVQGIGVSMGSALNWVMLENLTFNLSSFFGVMGNNAHLNRSNLDVGNGLVLQSVYASKLSNNIFNNTSSARDLAILNSANVNVINNTIVGAPLGVEQSVSTATQLRNNIIVNADNLLGFPADATLAYNIFTDGDLTGVAANISLAPVFVNSIGGDFRLAVHSPGIAMGDPDSDVGQEPIANGFRINMGAFGGTEFASTINDMDNDLLPDSWELAFGLSVLTNNTFLDSDSDGFSDYHEFWAGSEPNNNLSLPLLLNNDFDNDGFDDAIDNCPDYPNISQADENGDGLGDACPDGVNIPVLPWFWSLMLAIALLALTTSKLASGSISIHNR